MTKIVLVDLFSGIGGFAEGFRRAGVEFAAHYFAEVAPGPISIYKKHFQKDSNTNLFLEIIKPPMRCMTMGG